MTQIFRLTQSNLIAPGFTPILDGAPATVVVTFNVSAQRYYVNIYQANGELTAAVPLVETGNGVALTGLAYDPHQGAMIATRTRRFYRPLGQIVQMTLQDCDPASLNGQYDATVISPNQFSFPVAGDPGPIKQPGSAQRYLDMIGPWFQSSLIYRNGQFEVRP